MSNKVYINGDFISREEASVDIEDRGYQFADGVYEVVNSYRGKPFKMKEHFDRLKASAEALDINYDNYDLLYSDAEKLVKDSQLDMAKLYIQITRGTEPRSHAYSDGLSANVVMTVSQLVQNPDKYYTEGAKAITVPDERWPRCYIKSISLLPNILAKKEAKRAGAFEAIQVRDGFVTEGTSSNLFIVQKGEVITPPATNYILNGITRRVVIAEAKHLGYVVKERSIPLQELYNADEVFLTGTTTEVMPVVEIDGRRIGNGRPGRVTVDLYNRYRELLGLY